MNLKQTMKFPSETPGQKEMKGKAPQGSSFGEFFSEPKTHREKQTHPSTLGARGRPARPDSVLEWQQAGHTRVARAHVWK